MGFVYEFWDCSMCMGNGWLHRGMCAKQLVGVVEAVLILVVVLKPSWSYLAESRMIGECVTALEAFSGVLPLGIQGDNPNAQIITFKLDGTNYLEWSQSANIYNKKRKLGYINGHVVEPSILDT